MTDTSRTLVTVIVALVAFAGGRQVGSGGATNGDVIHAQVKFEDCGELAGLEGAQLEDCMAGRTPTPPPTVPDTTTTVPPSTTTSTVPVTAPPTTAAPAPSLPAKHDPPD